MPATRPKSLPIWRLVRFQRYKIRAKKLHHSRLILFANNSDLKFRPTSAILQISVCECWSKNQDRNRKELKLQNRSFSNFFKSIQYVNFSSHTFKHQPNFQEFVLSTPDKEFSLEKANSEAIVGIRVMRRQVETQLKFYF